VSHHNGRLSEGLNTTERLSKSENLQVLEEVAGLSHASLNIERDHATGTTALLHVNSVLGVALKAGVANTLDTLVALEHLSDGHGVRVGTLDADFESLGAAECNPGVEGGKAGSHSLENEEKFVVEFAAVEHHGSSNDIGVSTNVLGDRVGDNVGTKLERVSVDGSGESVVDDEQDSGTLEGIGDLFDVKALEGRVGGGLEPAKFSVLLDALFEGSDVAEVGKGNLNLGVGVEDLVEVALGSTVHIVDTEDVVAVGKHVSDGNMGGHSGGAGESILGLLHGGEVALKVEASGVSATSVVEDNGLSGSGLGVGSAHGDGRRNTAPLVAGFVTSVDKSSGNTPEKICEIW